MGAITKIISVFWYRCCNGLIRTRRYLWTDTAGGNWSHFLNRSPNQIPGQLNNATNTDGVMNTAAGVYAVTFDVGINLGVRNGTNHWVLHNLPVGGFGKPILSIAINIK